MEDVGTSYGGIWQCGNQALTQALGKYGRRSVFDEWKRTGEAMGIDHVESSPLTRSSYHAREAADAAERS